MELKILICDYSLRTLEKDELLIKVVSCGVCGTDRHIYEGRAPSSIPIILGHEYSGIIVEKGGLDSRFSIGDKVAIDPNIYCGHCDYCRKGMVNFCENLSSWGNSKWWICRILNYSDPKLIFSHKISIYLLPHLLNLFPVAQEVLDIADIKSGKYSGRYRWRINWITYGSASLKFRCI